MIVVECIRNMKLREDFIICFVFTAGRNTTSIYKKRKDFIKIEFETSSKFIQINKFLDIKLFENRFQREIAKIPSWRNRSNFLGLILLVILIHLFDFIFVESDRVINAGSFQFRNRTKRPDTTMFGTFGSRRIKRFINSEIRIFLLFSDLKEISHKTPLLHNYTITP